MIKLKKSIKERDLKKFELTQVNRQNYNLDYKIGIN